MKIIHLFLLLALVLTGCSESVSPGDYRHHQPSEYLSAAGLLARPSVADFCRHPWLSRHRQGLLGPCGKDTRTRTDLC